MKRIIVLIGMVFVFLACTGDFKEINTDKSGVTDEDLQADYNEHGIRLGIIQQGIYFRKKCSLSGLSGLCGILLCGDRNLLFLACYRVCVAFYMLELAVLCFLSPHIYHPFCVKKGYKKYTLYNC